MAVDESFLAKITKKRSPSEIAADREPAPALAAAPAIDFSDGNDDQQEAAKKSDPLPQPNEPYRPCARFMNRLQSDEKILHFVLKNGTVEGFAYSDLRRIRLVAADAPGASPVLMLRFVEAGITDVEIRGRHLRDIHYHISQGVMPWVWEFPGHDFEDEKRTVITRITIQPAKGSP